MPNTRKSELLLVICFLGIIALAPLSQTVIDLRRGEGIQALEVFRARPTSANLRSYERALEDASVWARLARPWANYVRFALATDGGSKVLIGNDGWLFYRPGFDYLTQSGKTTALTGSTNAAAAIIDFRDQLRKRGVQLLVMPAPNKESVYPEKVSRTAMELPPIPSPETKTLITELEAAGVEIVNLFEAYTRYKRGVVSRAPLYLVQDSHWSTVGLELAAQTAAEHIRAQNCLATNSLALAYETRSVPVSHAGDVLRMLQIPVLERKVSPEEITAHQVITERNRDLYKDAPDSEVLVLGDSFLRIFETDEPGAAGFVAHLAKQLGRPVSSVVNDGGASTLVRQKLHDRPELLRNKKIVLWEFVERDIRFGTEGWQKVALRP